MLYILLGIIAVGVLLASQEGKELLDVLWKLALIAGGLYIGFWVVIIIIGLLFLVCYLGFFGVYIVYKKHQRGAFKKENIKKQVKDFWVRNWTNATLKNRFGLICVIFLILFIIFTWVIVPLFLA